MELILFVNCIYMIAPVIRKIDDRFLRFFLDLCCKAAPVLSANYIGNVAESGQSSSASDSWTIHVSAVSEAFPVLRFDHTVPYGH